MLHKYELIGMELLDDNHDHYYYFIHLYYYSFVYLQIRKRKAHLPIIK